MPILAPLSKTAEGAARTLLGALDFGIDRCVQEGIDRESLSEAILEVAARMRRIGEAAIADRPRPTPPLRGVGPPSLKVVRAPDTQLELPLKYSA